MILGNKHKVAIPTRGELRNPISILRSSVVYDDSNAGLDENFALVANVWARVDRANGVYLDNEEKKHELMSNFIIDKNRDIKIQDGDYVLFEDKLYRVRSVMELEQGVEFWQLACTADGSFTDRVVDSEIIADAPKEVQVEESVKSPFWLS